MTALACERPARREHPLSRYRTAEMARLVQAMPDAPAMSRSTIWRILDQDAIKPWQFRSGLFPRDPRFAQKAGVVLDRYAGHGQGRPLDLRDGILSADEKTSIQARIRKHASLPSIPDHPMAVEHA